MMYQGPVVARLAHVQRLFKCIKNEVRGHRRTDARATDATGEHIDHERHVQPALPCRDIGEKRNPKLIRPVSLELPVDPVQRARRARIGSRRAKPLAANCAWQALQPHQPCDRTACHRNAFPVHLLSDLRHTIGQNVGLADALDLGAQNLVAFRARTTSGRISKLHRMASVTRRGNLQDLADRLDPKVSRY